MLCTLWFHIMLKGGGEGLRGRASFTPILTDTTGNTKTEEGTFNEHPFDYHNS